MWFAIVTAFILGWCAGWVFLGVFGKRIAHWFDALDELQRNG